MKVALVCDSMSAYGGAERVIEQIIKSFPSADIYTVLDAVPEGQRDFLGDRKVTSSFLQRLPQVSKYYRTLLHFWPLAVEQLDVTRYDLVLSSHHSVAYGVLTRPGQVHVSYVHSPMRYAWDLQHQYLQEARHRGLASFMARRTLHKVRIWDYVAAQRPDAIATNSHFVQQRLWRTHRRESEVIYPPVRIDGGSPPKLDGGYYLSVGRLVPYKRIDLLASAFAEMPDRRLKIVGEGPEQRRIATLAGRNVEVMGYQSQDAVRQLLAGARAYIFAGVEDFGITAVEAQASGTPVIAYRHGGLVETVLGMENAQPTGHFFDEQSTSAIIDAINVFESNRECFRPDACIANAERFNENRFRAEYSRLVDESLTKRAAGGYCIQKFTSVLSGRGRSSPSPDVDQVRQPLSASDKSSAVRLPEPIN